MQKIKDYLKKFSPDRKLLLDSKCIAIFGSILHDPRLWHFNRRPIARAFAIGVMCAWIPLPFHSLIAVIAAIHWHANLPLSVALVWLSNPFTLPIQIYVAYELGLRLLQVPPHPLNIQLSIEALLNIMHEIWQPLLLGALICGIIASLIAYAGIKLVWRYFVVKHWLERRKRNVVTTTT